MRHFRWFSNNVNTRFAWELGWKKFTNKVLLSCTKTTNICKTNALFCLVTFHSFVTFLKFFFSIFQVIELITGQFDRNCSDDEKCESGNSKTIYRVSDYLANRLFFAERKNRVNKNVHCCSDDNCNGQNSLFPPAMVSIMMVVAISNVISSF